MDSMENGQLLTSLVIFFLAFLSILALLTSIGVHHDKRSTSVWQVILLRSGDVESNPGPNKTIAHVVLVASLLLRALALHGRTECQLKSSDRGREWVEVHCTAPDAGRSRDINCYVDSELTPFLHPPNHEGGLITASFLAHKPNKINCCSVNGTAVGADECNDFVDEHPTPPPTTRSSPTSDASALSSTTHPAMTTPLSSRSPYFSTTLYVDGSGDVTHGASDTLVIACTVIGTLVAVVIVLGAVAVTFPKQVISMGYKIEQWKKCQKREACSVDADKGEVADQSGPMFEWQC